MADPNAEVIAAIIKTFLRLHLAQLTLFQVVISANEEEKRKYTDEYMAHNDEVAARINKLVAAYEQVPK